MKRLLLDEMLSGEISRQTKLSGIDALALVAEAELRGIPDSQVLELARSQSRILVTANIGDFELLNILWLAEARIHSGILYINSKAFPFDRNQLGRIVVALNARAAANHWPTEGTSDFL